MRRVATILTAFCAAAAVAMASASSALAAQGILTVSGNRYVNPTQGCYTGKFWPLSVNNRTDTRVLVYDNGACQGTPSGSVAPRQSRIFEFGSSVYVPR